MFSQFLVRLMETGATPRLGMHHEGVGGFGPGHGGGGLLLHKRLSADRIKVAVLGYLSHQDEDLLVACLH
jgi:hypothetical protein